MSLIVNLVTRGRPQLLLQTLQRTLPNIVLPDTKLFISCDVDDFPTYTALHHHFGTHSNVHVSIEPREDATSAKYNRALVLKPDLICNLSDYTAITTPAWDRIITEKAKIFPDGIGVIVNPMRNASFSDLYIMTKGMYDLLGWYAPPYFSYWFWDHWVDELARRIDRMAMAPVAVEYVANKPATQGLKDVAWWGTWFDAGYAVRRGQSGHLLSKMEEPDWRKQMLFDNAALHEFRTKWINDNVRGMAKGLEAMGPIKPAEDRYLRCKQAAINLIPELLKSIAPPEAQAWQNALIEPTTIMNIPKVA